MYCECTILLHILRESPTPSENRKTPILNRKSQVCPAIRTQSARTECHCYTTCATTTAKTWKNLRAFILGSVSSFQFHGCTGLVTNLINLKPNKGPGLRAWSRSTHNLDTTTSCTRSSKKTSGQTFLPWKLIIIYGFQTFDEENNLTALRAEKKVFWSRGKSFPSFLWLKRFVWSCVGNLVLE